MSFTRFIYPKINSKNNKKNFFDNWYSLPNSKFNSPLALGVEAVVVSILFNLFI